MDSPQKQFIELLVQKPNLTKFDEFSTKILKKALASPVFGGSVLLPVGSANSLKREKKNPLYDEI